MGFNYLTADYKRKNKRAPLSISVPYDALYIRRWPRDKV